MDFLVKALNVIRTLTSQVVRIIDISKWQSTYDDSKLFNFDIYETSDSQHLIVKASQGIYADYRYAYHILQILARAIFYGTYHFADMRYSAIASARYWAAQINALPEDIYRSSTEITRHWLDVENAGFRGYTKDQGRLWLRTFLEEVERLCPGIRFGIYTSYYGWTDNISWMPEIAERDLWIAHYGTDTPSIPREWYNAGKTYLIHQKCDNCTTCGACGKPYGAASISIDFNEFHGTQEEFDAWHLPEENGDDEMSSAEYLELKERIDEQQATLDVLAEQLATHTHDGGTPPPTYSEEYIITADPNLRMRDAPETGAVVVGIPYGQTVLVKPGSAIADSAGRGYWVEAKWNAYEGWLADWYLKKK